MTTNPLVITSWQQAGARLGLTYAAGSQASQEGLTLSGAIDGFSASVKQHYYRSTEQVLYSGTSTLFNVGLGRPTIAPGLVLRPARGLLRHVHVKRRDLPVGEREWDPAFSVEGTPTEAARRFLTEERRVALVAACPTRFKWVLRGGDLTHRLGRLVIEESQIVSRLLQLIHIAGAIRNPTDRGHRLQNDWSQRPTGRTMRMVPAGTRASRLGRRRTSGHRTEPERRAVVTESHR